MKQTQIDNKEQCEVAVPVAHPENSEDLLKAADELDLKAEESNKQGLFAEAETLYRRSAEIREAVFGPEHPDVANSLNNLAILLSELGKHAEAELLYRRSLAISEQVHGPEHADVASSLNNLAALLRGLGKHAEAEQLHRRALAISEKIYGLEHADVATRKSSDVPFMACCCSTSRWACPATRLCKRPSG